VPAARRQPGLLLHRGRVQQGQRPVRQRLPHRRADLRERPLFPVSLSAYGPCAPDGFLESLPSGAAGRGCRGCPLSLPSMVASRLKVAKQFTISLPDGGRFRRRADPAQGHVRLLLPRVRCRREPGTGAPFLLQARWTWTSVPARAASDSAPYTLRSDIFNALITAFEKVTSGTPRVKPLPPQNLCFDGSAFDSSQLGPGVANIDS
jgi:hypothetical protein